jgi:hypothetical protein
MVTFVIEFGKVVGLEGIQMYGVAFSDDGRWLVGVSPAGFLSLFETATWRLVNKLAIDAQLISVSFSPTANILLPVRMKGRCDSGKWNRCARLPWLAVTVLGSSQSPSHQTVVKCARLGTINDRSLGR